MLQPRRSHPTLLIGLASGAGLGFVEITTYRGFGSTGLIIDVVLLLAIAGLMGYRASSKTGKVGSAVLVGFLIGLISSVVFSVIAVGYVLANIDALRQYLQENANNLNQGITYTNSLVIGSLVLILVIVAVVSCLLGLGAGALGGAIGKRRIPAQAVPPQPQGAMYVPPPPYPPQYQAAGSVPPPPPYWPQEVAPPVLYSPPAASEYIPPQE